MSATLPAGSPTILIVDDDEMILHAFKRELRDREIRVELETDPVAALERVRHERYSVIVSDQQMPGMSGIEFLARVKAMEPDTVRVLLTGHADIETTVRAINEGEIHRFIQKPWARLDLLRHIETALERHTELQDRRTLAESLSARNSELSQLNRTLREVAQRDRLTGLFNRGEFDLQLDRQVKLFARDRQPFSLALGDIDDFKHINDTYGHPAGDEVIRTAAGILMGALRGEVDGVFRYGGEEFATILRNSTHPPSGVPIERILQRTRSAVVIVGDTRVGFTMSFGLGQYRAGETAQALLERVDAALYQAKRTGKDRMHLADSPQP